MSISYSAVIRTVGKAGTKYQRLLDSLDAQTIKPCEILVVLPQDYVLPKEKLGYERFVFSKKGMVSQRIYGTQEAKGEYLLFLDDDVEFESDFVEKLIKPILQKEASVTFPIDLTMLPQPGLGKWAAALMGSAIPMLFNRDKYYIKILPNGGWAYNIHLPKNREKFYYSDSAVGTCFLVSKKNALDMKFQDELWLEQTKYCLPDDQVMFYKYNLLGYKVVGIPNTRFIHLDAGSSSPDRALEATYAGAKNKLIFWHRFIYKQHNKRCKLMFSLILLAHTQIISFIHVLLLTLLSFNRKKLVFIYLKGLCDGIKFLRSEEYRTLKVIKKNA